MRKIAEFFFDVGSPASYLAWTQMPALCARAHTALVYRPMLLGGVFQATGNTSPATVPAKARYMTADLTRFAQRYGVPFKMNPYFPISTLTLMRSIVGMQLKQPAQFDAFIKMVFEGMWVHALNLNDPAVMGQMLVQAGFSVSETLMLASEAEVKAALKANTDEAVERGVFGAPTTFVGETMFFGQDRLDFVREALG